MSPIKPIYQIVKEHQFSDLFSGELPEPDVQIRTSGSLRISVHSSILAMASQVLENIMDRPPKHRRSERVIPILGVPCDAVCAFVRFLYTSRCSDEEKEKYAIHLLALSHVYSVPQLKQKCSKILAERLTVENVIDMLQLARLCDASDLYLRSMKLVTAKFKAAEDTEAWKFLRKHDPWLELEILQFIDEIESRKSRTRRNKEEQNLYLQLSEAMDCLSHICTEGCTHVGPYDMDITRTRQPCGKFSTCQSLQLLIRHFATCKKRVNGGCSHCNRMWQLLRLHASLCEHPDLCKVPLCRQFKLKMQQERRRDDAKWRRLVKKVMLAKVASSLSVAKRKRESEPEVNSQSKDDRIHGRNHDRLKGDTMIGSKDETMILLNKSAAANLVKNLFSTKTAIKTIHIKVSSLQRSFKTDASTAGAY